jgi:site-specific recombinase XerC
MRTEPNGRGRPLAAKTVYNGWAALRSFSRWLSETHCCPNPMASLPAPKAPQPLIEPLSREDAAPILTTCDGTRAASTRGRAAFAMRRDTALRDRAIVLVLPDARLRASCALSS